MAAAITARRSERPGLRAPAAAAKRLVALARALAARSGPAPDRELRDRLQRLPAAAREEAALRWHSRSSRLL